MNPMYNKQTRLHRSISTKVNPEEQKQKFLKMTNAPLQFHREFDLRQKGIEIPSAQSFLDIRIETKINQNKESFIKMNTLNNLPRPSSLSAREQLKSKLNPCNPFESLTQSSIRRNPENQKAMELILAHRKIGELENSIQTLNKELALVREHKFQLEKEKGTHLAGMKGEINELVKINKQLVGKVKSLEEENQKLKKQIQTEKVANSPKDHINLKPTQSLNPSQNFKSLGQQFQRKINDLYEENYKLKNKLGWFEGKLEESETLVSSLKQLNEMLEKRFNNEEQEDEKAKDKLEKENYRLREENLALREQKEDSKSEYEINLLKLQNQIQELRNQLKINYQNQKYQQKGAEHQFSLTEIHSHPSSYKKINKLQDLVQSLQFTVKEQIDQIIRLKEKNKKLSKMVSYGSH